ncbi:tail fiber domain-containing protein [Flavobacterium sp.]|uniref:tail fiber domain-containing protein n=1 Tax=Flavobacterium sp. TaxID=239 RepID=UPI0025FFA4D7|nr:tail fiber domain-containing protein [Flavobacterium sp.]
MANLLLIEKQPGGYFKFTLNGDSANAVTSIQNDLLAVGNQLHFKTGNGANIIKEQFIYPEDVTIIAGGTYTFTTVAQVWTKLIDIDYFAWLGTGGSGIIDRFSELIDTFQYVGNAGKAVVVDNSELKLVPVTLHNVSTFTELTDTPDALVPNKMVVVNTTGDALILQDQPTPPENFLNSVGYFDYNDLVTQTTPLTAVANVPLKLTNDTAGANTNTSQNPYGVSYVWDTTTNQFHFAELSIGDTIDIRVHVQVTTTAANQKISLKAKFGIGSAYQFENSIYSGQFKTAGLNEISFVAPFYIGSTLIRDYPAELTLITDAGAAVKVDGWYVRILRKNINIITVDYTVPDATTSVKGIVRLGGDLGGTANTPTVPELANKVSNTRTVGTTAPLLGGGTLNGDLTLSIPQANSIDSGYLSFGDWTHFNEAYNDKVVSIAVSGTTTKTLTITQQDGGTLTTSWTDINTDAITSVFGRTGDVVSANGDYTTSQVTEGTNLYYTNTRVSANTDVAANTVARHNAVTLGTANGLSLSTQVLSLGLASGSANGALSSTDWNTFNNKQSALGYTAANDANVVHLTGAETITGTKSFNSTTGIGIRSNNSGSSYGIYSDNSSTGVGMYVANSGSGKGFQVANALGSFGNLFEGSYNGTIGFSVAYDGQVNTQKLVTNLLQVSTFGAGMAYSDSSGNVGTLTGTSNSLTYWSSASTIGSLSTSTYPSLTELSYVKGVTSSIQTQLNSKQATLTNPITGTGTTNYLSKFTGTGTLGNSLIYDNGTNVGIGTTSPNNLLTLNSSGAAGDSTSIGLFSTFSQSTNRNWSIGLNLYAYGDFAIRTGSTLNGNPDTTRFLINPSGNVGIGTTSPSEKLEVQSGAAGAKIKVSNSGGGYASLECSSNATSVAQLNFTNQLSLIGGNVGIGTTSPIEKLEVITGGAFTNIYAGANGNGSAGIAFSTDNRANTWFVGSRKDAVGGSIGTDRFNLLYGTNSILTATTSGNVGIGTTSPNYKLSVLSANNVSWLEDTSGASGATFILFSAPGNTGIGSISRVGTTSAIAYNSTSDYRLKEDLKPINGLEKISKIKVYDFKWKNHTDRMDGVIAHELQEVVPYAVTGEKDAEQMQSVDYSKLVPILVQSIQELKAEIEILKNK